MRRLAASSWLAARALAWSACLVCTCATWAQGSGVGKAAVPRPAASAPAAPQTPVDKEILNGPVTVKVDVEGAVQRITIQSQRPYAPVHQYAALDAARAVQRDVPVACGKLCRPSRMTAPRIDAQGVLKFDIAVQGLDRNLTLPDITALLQGNPLRRTDAQPAAAPASAAKTR